MKIICNHCGKEFVSGCQACPWCGADCCNSEPSNYNTNTQQIGWTMLNGIGTNLSGEKYISEEWCLQLDTQLPQIRSNYPNSNYIIGTTSIVFLFIPLIPLETSIYLKIKHKSIFLNTYSYLKIYSPCGDNKVCWEHVKSSIGFYIWPMLILIYIALCIGNWIGGM